MGPREFLSVDSDKELTLEVFKQACECYFAPCIGKDLCYDVLAREQGSSSHTIYKVPDLKIIHVRFVGRANYESIRDDEDDDGVSHSAFTSEMLLPRPEIAKMRGNDTKSSPTKFPIGLSLLR